MKLSTVVTFCILGLASAQAPSGKGMGGSPNGKPPGGGMSKGKGGAGGAPKQLPSGLAGTLCAAKCLQQPMQASNCNITGLFPGKGGAKGGGMAGMPGMGAMGAPPGALSKRQAPTGTSSAGAPGGAPGGAIPKFSLSPEQSSAIAAAKSCFCGATAPLKAAADTCIPSSCATATGAGEGYAKIVNGLCKGVSGFTPITPPPAVPAAATPAPSAAKSPQA